MVSSEPPKKRRISYAFPPPPTISTSTLVLPSLGVNKLGQSAPTLTPVSPKPPSGSRTSSSKSSKDAPKHRLGVTALALDPTTVLQDRSSPRGILYSGGRDGLIVSTDLGLSMREKLTRSGLNSRELRRHKEKWELITGWANDDEASDEEEEDPEHESTSGDILGEVARKRRGSQATSIAQATEWQLNEDGEALLRSKHRQSAQAHLDWVNDIKLCNQNQTVISASSDGTVKAWSPHHTGAGGPSKLGQHSDYARCLAPCPSQNWIACGSFDKTIKLWDTSRVWGVSATPQDAMTTLESPEADKTSIYALAVDSLGTTIVSGGPDRIIRMWDPRAGLSGRGGKNGKLVGHTDNIRSILISEDGRYILSASSDASIKLWSLQTQRCLHTFTHHTESVWALWSEDPGLEIFYSGGKSGLVSRVDVKSELYDVGEGECIVLCQDTRGSTTKSAGISSLVSFDNSYLWTASGDHSDIKKWRIPKPKGDRIPVAPLPSRGPGDESEAWIPNRRTQTPSIISTSSNTHVPESASTTSASGYYGTPGSPREPDPPSSSMSNDAYYGVSFDSMVRLGEAIDVYGEGYGGTGRPGSRTGSVNASGFAFPPSTSTQSMLQHAGSLSSLINTPQPGSFQAQPATSVPPIRPSGPVHHFSSSSSNTAVLSSSGSIGPMKSPSIKPTSPSQQMSARTAYQLREVVTTAKPYCTSGPVETTHGEHGLIRATLLNDRVHALSVDSLGNVGVWDIMRGIWKGGFAAEDVRLLLDGGCYSPREALEAIRSRIEGEAVVSSWCSVDTKTGLLTVYIMERYCFDAEVYADEIGFTTGFSDESKLNLGKVVLKNLWHGFLKDELNLRVPKHRSSGESTASGKPRIRKLSNPSSTELDPSARMRKSSAPLTMQSALVITNQGVTPAIPVSPPHGASKASPLIAPMIPIHVMKETLATIPQSPDLPPDNDTTPSVSSPQQQIRRLRSGTLDSQHQQAVSDPGGGDYFSRAKQSSNNPTTPSDETPREPVTPGGLMGRLKSLGKKSAASTPAAKPTETPAPAATITDAETTQELKDENQSFIDTIFSKHAPTPPPSIEAPSLGMSSRVMVMIAEESDPDFETIYRGTVSSTQQHHDLQLIEHSLPHWVLEYLLLNKLPENITTPAKLSFVMCPYVPKEEDNIEQLPELLNTAQSKLTASRYLRVRKLAAHVQEKLDRLAATAAAAAAAAANQPTSDPLPPNEQRGKPKAEDLYEILCGDVLLPLDMTLAQVRQYVWKQAGELVLHYRSKLPPAVGTAM
ncbi:hypothetical protein DL96DRAFT_1614982 [Flagelloscypha sp. PMI_526]|nr:hypothetical protein DL96DRAFT_1614982 [Flagelloscypha sp. PMI_526]